MRVYVMPPSRAARVRMDVAKLVLLRTSVLYHAAIQDSRCYLMNGGAVESFYISEDTAVGSIIGTLSVNGDPSEGTGNISLKLQEKNAAVGIAPGSKNLTLLRALDREEKLGPSNVYVNVRCDRRRTTDPSFVIPVSVRVWDVNDNAPQWAHAPYRLRLSELTAVGTRVAPQAGASDADQPGPHATVHYSVLPGPHSDYFEFPNELEATLVVRRPLDYESVRNLTVTLRAQDQGAPPRHSDTTLAVEVLDADDQNPKFAHDHYTAVLPDDAEEGTILETAPEPISARDQDVGINAPLHYSVTGAQRDLLVVDRDTGRVAVTRRLLEGNYLPLTVVIRATQVDNPDRYALATLAVRGATAAAGVAGGAAGAGAGVRFSRAAYEAAVREDAPPGAVLATLATLPPRAPRANPLQFFVSERSFLDKFAINSAGEVLLRKPLDYETQDRYHYQVMVTDGVANDTASINITVLNVNEWEPRFRYPQYEFRVEGDEGGVDGDAGGLRVGRLDVHDGDAPDTVTLTLRGAHASMFYINESGDMFMRQEALPVLNTSVLHVVATAIDSGTPPRQTSVPVTVHVGARLAAGAAGAGARGAVVALFAAALALLALLVCLLLLYICRQRRRAKTSSSPSGKASPRAPPGALAGSGPGPGPGSGGPTGPGGPLGASSGSLLSVSAGASTILANSSSSLDLRPDSLAAPTTRSATVGRQSQRFPTKTKIAPAPPAPGDPACESGHRAGGPGGALTAGGMEGVGGAGGAEAAGVAGVEGVALMSDHLGRGAGRSGVAWPSATIPARVKKLSWDTHHHDKGSGEAGVLHDATNPALADHLNLTVYF